MPEHIHDPFDKIPESMLRPWNNDQHLCFTEKETACIFAMAGLAIMVTQQETFQRAHLATMGLSLCANEEELKQGMRMLRERLPVPSDYFDVMEKCLIFRLQCQKIDQEKQKS